MNEIKEILTAVLNDGITDERLAEIRLTRAIETKELKCGPTLTEPSSARGITKDI